MVQKKTRAVEKSVSCQNSNIHLVPSECTFEDRDGGVRKAAFRRNQSSPSLYVCYVIALLAPWIKYSNSLRNVLLGSNSGLGTFAALQSVYVLVKFCRWFKFSFLLFQTTIPPKQRKIKFEPRIKLIHNIYLWFKTSKTTFG